MTLVGVIKLARFLVSIHTPTKGVTKNGDDRCKSSRVSIHTPTKGVTWCQLCRDWLCYVSIHTPTKGVTFNSRYAELDVRVSIHTPTKGVTPRPHEIRQVPKGFNPHTHEGCDRVLTPIGSHRNCFNPHTHEGCDSLLPLSKQQDKVSIHTPTKGVTIPV